MSLLASRPNKAATRRRSQRILLSIAISVKGQTSAGQIFTETTKTSVVNAHGAAIPLQHAVGLGASLKITNLKTGETSLATVVDIPSGAEAGAEYFDGPRKPDCRQSALEPMRLFFGTSFHSCLRDVSMCAHK
jgi:hypothetical protein